jgi:predicted N-formylglutamate amidohydrolase
MAEAQKSAQTAAPNGVRSLLAVDEPAPFEVYNDIGAAPVLLVCDHASRFIPRALAGLGLSEAELCRHIAWDIGIADHTVCRIDGLLPSHREDA